MFRTVRAGVRRWPRAALLAAALLLVLVRSHGPPFDLSRLIVAGDLFVDPHRTPSPIAVLPHSAGYDGQFFYRLALHPLSGQRTADGVTLDSPVVRAQRIAYPVLAHAAALGRPALVPLALVAVNVLALLGVATAGVALCRTRGLDARFGLLFALYPGFLLTLVLDTAEIVAAALGLWAVQAADRRRPLAAGLLGGAAVLAKETTLAYLAGFGVAALWRDARARRLSPGTLALALTAAAYLAWQAVLRARWGSLPVSDLGVHDFRPVPFAGLAASVAQVASHTLASPIPLRNPFALLAMAALLAFALRVVVPRRRGWAEIGRALPFGLPFGAYLAMTALFSTAVWNEPYGFERVSCDLYVFGLLLVLARDGAAGLRQVAPAVLGLWTLTWVFGAAA